MTQPPEDKWQKLEDDIAAIKARNENVSADKAWETSRTRRAIIFVFTYIIASVYFRILGVEPAYLHGLVPSCAYLLSTWTLPFAKKIWMRKTHKP